MDGEKPGLSLVDIRRCNEALKRVYRAPKSQSLAEQFPFTGEALRQAFGDGSRPATQMARGGVGGMSAIEVGPWYLRVWQPANESGSVSFEATRVDAMRGGRPQFLKRGASMNDPVFVFDLEEAAAEVRGSVRFDGGIHVYFGGDHEPGYLYADPEDLIALGVLFERVRSEAVRIFKAAGNWCGGLAE